MLLDKREELGAENDPTIVTGDCNPFASSGASRGSFESNLAAGGILKVYEATGSTGGYAGLDKIFASQEHWTWSNAADVGTGTSDHPAIAADLTLSPPTNNPAGQKCGGAVDFTYDPNQACETYLWGPTGDDTMHCFAYGGSNDPCHLNNNNDQDDGIFKDPSQCLGDTFYLWDEPDTQGRDYNWAGRTWLEYSQRFAQELEQLRSQGTKVTGPLLKAGTSGVIEQNMQTFFDACGAACLDPTDPAYIDVIAINGFCGPWNGDAGCRGGAKFIYDEAASASRAFGNLPVYITNWSRLQTSLPLDQIDAIESIDEFFPSSGVVGRVYWFGARDYGGGSGTTSYLNNILPDGRSLGEVWRAKCESI